MTVLLWISGCYVIVTIIDPWNLRINILNLSCLEFQEVSSSNSRKLRIASFTYILLILLKFNEIYIRTAHLSININSPFIFKKFLFLCCNFVEFFSKIYSNLIIIFSVMADVLFSLHFYFNVYIFISKKIFNSHNIYNNLLFIPVVFN